MNTQGSNVLFVDFRPDASIIITAEPGSRPWESLSFAGGSGELWNPERTGRYADDCRLGRFYAGELLSYIRVTGALPLLGHVCEAISRETWGGVEVGFFQVIAEAANA